MHTVKSHTTIGDSRTINCFRSCRHSTGPPTAALDKGRVAFEQAKLARRQARIYLTAKPNGRLGQARQLQKAVRGEQAVRCPRRRGL